MKDFTRGNITKQLLAFTVPMLIGNLFQQLYSMADMLIVGRFVSGSALAAIGISGTVTFFVLSVIMGLSTGASVLISQFYGAGQHGRLKLTVSVSVIVLLVLTAVITASGIFLAPVFLRLLDTTADVWDNALVYLQITFGGIVFPIIYNMYMAYMRALGDSRRPLYFLICSTVLNIILDLFFIVLLDMGVAGAAIATITAQAVAAVLCFIYAMRNIPLLRVSKLTFDTHLFSLILKYGTPAAIQSSLVSLAQLIITRLINSFGSSAMAGITAAGRIDQFAMMPIMNIGMALSMFVGQNMGAGLEDRAKKGLRTAMIFMLTCAVTMSAVLVVFSKPLISLFLSSGDAGAPEILRIGSEYLSIMVIFYFLFAILFAYNGFFRGAGDAVIAMVFPVTSLAIRTVSAYSLVGFAGMGPEALAWSIPIGWGLSSIGSVVYYKKRLWAGKTATATK